MRDKRHGLTRREKSRLWQEALDERFKVMVSNKTAEERAAMLMLAARIYSHNHERRMYDEPK